MWFKLKTYVIILIEWHEFANVAGSQTYDNIIYDAGYVCNDIEIGDSWVYYFNDSLGLSEDDTKKISDHYPVYFELEY